MEARGWGSAMPAAQKGVPTPAWPRANACFSSALLTGPTRPSACHERRNRHEEEEETCVIAPANKADHLCHATLHHPESLLAYSAMSSNADQQQISRVQHL